jgi:hypothetical protein
MFSCLNYGSSSVAPEGNPQTLNTLPTIQFITLDNISNTAIIRMEGVSNNSATICKTINNPKIPNAFFVNVNYASRGIFKDVSTLSTNAKAIDEGRLSESEYSHRRLFELIETIKKYLKDARIERVIVVGVSHGSILVHAALLKIQMDMGVGGVVRSARDHINLIDAINSKLEIYTIGSPRYLPKGLLMEGKLLNFYHVKDKWIRIVHLLPFAKGFQVPNLSKINMGDGKDPDKADSLYDESKALVFVNKCNFMPKPRTEAQLKLGYTPYYMPYYESDINPTLDFSIFHAAPAILYPLMDINTRYILSRFDIDDNDIHHKPIFNPCYPPATRGGSKAKQYIKFQNKIYKIKKDKISSNKYITVKRVKTYLSTIRGKYRYTK